MNKLELRWASMSDLTWINAKYQEVDFKPSDDKDHIVLAYLDGVKVGQGRITEITENDAELGGIYVYPKYMGKGIAHGIVEFLCEQNPILGDNLWCLPFKHLEAFYKSYGFDIVDFDPPEEILSKKKWCDSNYDQQVLLLCRINKNFG